MMANHGCLMVIVLRFLMSNDGKHIGISIQNGQNDREECGVNDIASPEVDDNTDDDDGEDDDDDGVQLLCNIG